MSFLRQTYQRYGVPDPGPDTLGADAPRLFSAGLLALIREDERVAAGEVGLLDYDPICICQDRQALTIIDVRVVAKDDNQAVGNVTFRNSGQVFRVALSLLRESGQWRIDDIEAPGTPSLRRFLADGLANIAETGG